MEFAPVAVISEQEIVATCSKTRVAPTVASGASPAADRHRTPCGTCRVLIGKERVMAS